MSRRRMTYKRLLHILFSQPATRRQAVQRRRLWIAVIMRLVMILVMILLLVLIITGIRSCSHRKAEKKAEEAAKKVAAESKDVQIGFTGCMILHQSILNSYKDESGNYNFTAPFEYVKDYYSKPAIMACEMEGCIGNEQTGISGYPMFCYPDVFPENLESLGFDLQALATNHIYDGKTEGLNNTLQTYNDSGVTYTGIRSSAEDKRYTILESGGIKIGYVDYTYGTKDSFNTMQVEDDDAELINMFREADPGDFYNEVESQIEAIENEGADFIVYMIHWGAEYELEPSAEQKAIAQKLCDLGVDVIIGGHPHVIQPVEVLKSDDGSHKTFCIYSIGNQFSNQTEGVSMETAHCEDGAIITFDLHKSKQGTVTISDMNLVPTWVYRNLRAGTVNTEDGNDGTSEGTEVTEDENAVYDYAVLPLDNIKKLEEKTGLSGVQDDAQASYERTMKIIGEGFDLAKEELVTKKKK